MASLATALIILVAIAGVASATVFRPIQVETVRLTPEIVTVSFTEPGVYDYDEIYTVYPTVYGVVQEVMVKEGDTVQAGDVIAVVSASEQESQIRQLQSDIEDYRAQINSLSAREQQDQAALLSSLENLKGQLTALETDAKQTQDSNASIASQIKIQEKIIANSKQLVQDARQELEHAEYVSDDEQISIAKQALVRAQNTLSQQELSLERLRSGNVSVDMYTDQRQSLYAQIAAVNNQLQQSSSGAMRQYYLVQIESAQASIDQMQEESGKSEIVAPVGGVVAKLPVNRQNVASQQSAIAEIAEKSRVEVFIPLREVDGIAVGDSVELLLDKRSGAETVLGVVTDISGEAQIIQSPLGLEERKVRVLVEPAEEGLHIGYTMDVRFYVYTNTEALETPKSAVFSKNGEECVWVIRKGALAIQPITKGVETRAGYVVEDGLQAGDVVVCNADNPALVEKKRAAGLE